MVLLLEKYLPAAGETVKAYQLDAQALGEAESIPDKELQLRGLVAEFQTLYDEAMNMPMDETHKKFMSDSYQQMQHAMIAIENSRYNKELYALHQLLGSFPANVLSQLLGIEPASQFKP